MASVSPNSAASSVARSRAGRRPRPAKPADEHQVVPPAERLVQARVLPGQPDPRPHPGRLGHHVEAQHADPARVGPGQRGDDPDQRGLARAVGPQQRRQRAGADREVDPGQRGDPFPGSAERLGDPGRLDGRGISRSTRIAHTVRLAVSEDTGQYGGLRIPIRRQAWRQRRCRGRRPGGGPRVPGHRPRFRRGRSGGQRGRAAVPARAAAGGDCRTSAPASTASASPGAGCCGRSRSLARS